MVIFKNKKDVFYFQSNNIKVKFSNPIIQSYDEYGACKTERGILYYYYDLTVYIKNNKTWNTLFNLHTYDFPAITTFKMFLEYITNNKPEKTKYQKEDLGDNNYLLSRTLEMDFLCEDYYSVTHYIREEQEKEISESFDIVIGKPFDYNREEMVTVSFKNLSKEDIETIINCVDSFIKYSIENNTQTVRKRNKRHIKSWKIRERKLYQISKNGKIENIFVVGDKINSLKVLHGDLSSQDFYSTEFCDFTIENITKEGIILNSGYEDIKKEYRKIKDDELIKIENIIDIFIDMEDYKLKYSEKEIAEDFLNILSESEKKEFLQENSDLLFNKWSESIINRTWMCREEHNLPKRVEDKGHHENVYESVKHIINLIKGRLL